MHVQEQKRRWRLGAVALALLAGAFGVYVNSLGGWVNALGLPPALDGSTPAAQNGFTLVALQAPPDENGAFQYPPGADPQATGTLRVWGMDLGADGKAGGVWVRLPPATFFTVHDLTATGRASTDETFPLRVALPPDGTSEQLLFMALPGGYPDTLRYMDVTLRSRQGPTAQWHITRLPRMRHVAPPATAQDTFDQNGVRLTLQATRQPYRDRPGAYIRYRLLPTVAPHAHQWEVDAVPDQDKARTDWESYPHESRQERSSMPLTGLDAQQMIAFYHGAIEEEFIQNPFVANDHFVTVSGTVTQFETHDERLTFHDVRVEDDDGANVFTVTRAQTGTTPSGITVTLPAQNRATFMQGETLVDPGLLLDVEPHADRNTLPNSPLTRIYHRPVGITLDFGKPVSIGVQTLGSGPHRKYQLSVPGHKPALLHDLTVIVRQRVDIQSWPLALTAPIRDTVTVPDRLVPIPPEGIHS